MPIEIPAPSMTFEVPLEDGARIRMRRHGNPDGVRLLVTHGNGFAADAYYPYWRHLLSGFDVLVFDFRNHGRTCRCALEPQLCALTRDLERVVRVKAARPEQDRASSIRCRRTAIEARRRGRLALDALMLFDPPDVPLRAIRALRGDGFERQSRPNGRRAAAGICLRR